MTTPALEDFPHQDALVEILYGVTMGDPQPYVPEGATMLEVMALAVGRWLTAHDATTIRQAKAEALREAAGGFREQLPTFDRGDAIDFALARATRLDAEDLEARASRIEAGE